MTYASGLNAKVAAAALVTFSAAFFLASHATQAQSPKHPKLHGKADAASIHALITAKEMGGGVVILLKPDGAIDAYAVNPTGGPDAITIYTRDTIGTDASWYIREDDGTLTPVKDPTEVPVPPTYGPHLKGEGSITDIKIFDKPSDDCVWMTINGRRICVQS